MTANRDILNKYTISLFLENVVSSNIEISQVMPVPISQNTFLNRRSQLEPAVIWCVSTKKFRQRRQLKFFLPFFDSRCGANFDEMNKIAYKTNFRVLKDT